MEIPLFDIDWTLLEGGNKAHDDAFDFAFKNVYNLPEASKREIQTDGMIDKQIIVEILKRHSVPEEIARAKMDLAVSAMAEYYADHESEGECVVMPGVVELLSELKSRRVPMGLLTGNVEGIAWRKVSRAGIRDFFSFGSFGNLAYKRVDLISIAAERARSAGINASVKDLVIVGDALLDVKCAKDGGIHSVAVGAGKFSVEQLAVMEPDLLLSTLKEKEKFLRFFKLI